MPIESLQLNSFAAYGEFVHNFANPRTIPAGRHTLVLLSDALDGFEESDESDNDYGAQWIWKPPTLNFGPVVTRPAPADPLAGREHVAGPNWDPATTRSNWMASMLEVRPWRAAVTSCS